MTLAEFQEKKGEFLIHLEVERNLASNTLRAYQSDLEQLYDFWQRINTQESIHIPLRQALERFFVMLYHNKTHTSSIARKISCFQSFEKFLLKQGLQLSLKLTRPRLEKKLPVYLSIDEMFHLLDTIKPDDMPTQKPYRDKAILELLYATGIRCSELVNIKLNDINIDQKTIRIMGKGGKERIVLFGAKAQEKLLAYILKERPAAERSDEKLFLNYRNQPITSRSIQRIFEMFRTFLKMGRKITPHHMRHSFATHLLNHGADLRMVQELLGHKTLSSTEKYTHVSSSELSKMCDTIHPINTSVKIRKS